MDIFTIEELYIIANLLDTAPLQGNLHTLPPALTKLSNIRVKMQGLIEAMQREQTEREQMKIKETVFNGVGKDE